MTKSIIDVTDQFCGAGGSSQGVRNFSRRIGGGVEVKLALNHWKLAIETHSTNFQETLHDCTDISACDPRRYPRTSILITSPECTNHSLAKGQKQVKAQLDLFDSGKLDPAAERSRATMWDVCRFAEYHQYECIIVENVVDARKWIMWEAWLKAMHLLGYRHKCVYLNSQHCHPTPQSRDRMYVVFWKKGNKAPKLDYTPRAYCQQCGNDVNAIQTWKRPDVKFGKYKQQYLYRCPVHGCVVEPYYYAAFNIIDWSDKGKRIGDRKKALSDNTLRRIKHGLQKYGNQALTVANYNSGYCKPSYEPIGTLTTSGQIGIAMPFIIKGEHTLMNGYVKSAMEAAQTQTVRQSMGMVFPSIIEMNRTGECKPATEPTATITAGGINHAIIQPESLKSFLAYNYSGNQVSRITDPIDTVSTVDRAAIIQNIDELVENCYYRMIKPHEVKLAMAFDKDYIILGDGKAQVKQCGNAVTPPVMEWLVEQCVTSLM